MSGHSKWSQIKRQKGVTDARRGQLFTKLAREIIMTAREGGANPDSNFQLRLAIQKAKDNNMPSDNIERALKRGSGEGGSSDLVEIAFEGYGPGGIAVLVQAMSDKRNRTVQEIRHAFARYGGNLGETGCVAWLFDSRGVISVGCDESNAEEIELKAIDAGAEDVKSEKGLIEIYTQPGDLEKVRQALGADVHIISAEINMVPKSTIFLNEHKAVQAMNFLDQLEEMDDVQRVFSNVDFPDSALEKMHN
ncbi:MAG: YebC/PmpR family DNA-binding transcriptional regulator [Dehalococcoidia bacterium]|nr:YebC/PmpR family DNA-binding transcriptional regulator [Dehalococcoidia bacterium]